MRAYSGVGGKIELSIELWRNEENKRKHLKEKHRLKTNSKKKKEAHKIASYTIRTSIKKNFPLKNCLTILTEIIMT